MLIMLQLGDFEVPVEITDRGSSISPHTGAKLAELTGVVTVRSRQAQERLLALIEDLRDQPVAQVLQGAEDAAPRQWRVSLLMHSSSSGGQGGANHTVTLQLQQYERRTPTELQINDLTTTPFAYRERVLGDGQLEIETKIALDDAGVERFKAILRDDDLVQVRRVGLSDATLRMHLRDPLWARQEDLSGDGLTRFDLRLNEENPAAPPPQRVPFFIGTNAAIQSTAFRAALLEELLAQLVEKGVLAPDEVEAMRASAEEKAFERLFNFYRVDSIGA